ncbi:hypothetical protein HAX54_011650 [Datura stramonium]|uniref:JmjC domain-containing protein n=1 Tax=Datura stramonium TaxID=4076 RepID=A0ABS8TIG5_DATST|nr:hypothetical protein [Datura stramonium]
MMRDPLYIFDEKFGEAAPELLKDYIVPDMFKEDFFDVLDKDQRPPFRWLIMGPERSGASWHVDPGLTSAWNTLLYVAVKGILRELFITCQSSCLRILLNASLDACNSYSLLPADKILDQSMKLWQKVMEVVLVGVISPGRVLLGVTVHVNEEDGDVNIDSPSSLQWWLDFYPLLAEEDKPIECTQLPGETIFVPSGHKGVCRAGLLALDDISIEDVRKNMLSLESGSSCSDLSRKDKRIRVDQPKGSEKGSTSKITTLRYGAQELITAKWREWLSKLWVGKPEIRDLIWKVIITVWNPAIAAFMMPPSSQSGLHLQKSAASKYVFALLIVLGACLALNADRWYGHVTEICAFHGFPLPTDDERLPVGTGSNPRELEACLHSLGTELEFYSLLQTINSPLRNHIPSVLSSGILYIENGLSKLQSWDGKGVPEVIANSSPPVEHEQADYPFGLWSKRQFDYRKAGLSLLERVSAGSGATIWPYVITERCKGKIYAQIRDSISWEDALNLASFLGEQLRNLHLVPCPALNDSTLLETQQKAVPNAHGNLEDDEDKICAPAEWNLFLRTLNRKKKDLCDRLTKWGDPIPRELIEKVEEYIPDDLRKVDMGVGSCTWIHSDVMDDNIHMEPCSLTSRSGGTNDDPELIDNVSTNGSDLSQPVHAWRPTHILDFSDLSVGDPISDLIPIYLDVFRGDSHLLKQFLDSYKLPFVKTGVSASAKSSGFQRLSYRAMCYCILHDENVLGAIFSTCKELRTAKSWEEVEEAVWGDLNSYTGSC